MKMLLTITSVFIIFMLVEGTLKTSHTGIFLNNQATFWLLSTSSCIWQTNKAAEFGMGVMARMVYSQYSPPWMEPKSRNQQLGA